MKPTDWKPATITLKDGTQLEAMKGEPIDNSEWRKAVLDYRARHEQPLNLPDQPGN